MRRVIVGSIIALSSLVACAREDAGTPSRAMSQELEQRPPVAKPSSPALQTPPRVAEAPSHEAVAPSLYDLEVRVTDHSGAVRALEEFRGHPVLVTMFYATCPAACPLLTSDLKRIEQKLPDAVRSNVRVLMVSFDSARDTPSTLSRLMTERAMDASRWTLASAPDAEARELAGVLNIRYRKLDNGEFFHSSSIVLLDAQGRPRARIDGVGGEVGVIVSALLESSLWLN